MKMIPALPSSHPPLDLNPGEQGRVCIFQVPPKPWNAAVSAHDLLTGAPGSSIPPHTTDKFLPFPSAGPRWRIKQLGVGSESVSPLLCHANREN